MLVVPGFFHVLNAQVFIVLGIYNFSLSKNYSWGYCSTILSGGPIFVTLACSFLVCTLMCFKFKSLRESEITVQKILMQFTGCF